MAGPPPEPIGRRWLAAAAVLGLVGSYAVARQDPVPTPELDVTSWINDVPEVVADVLWPVMQLGALWAPVAVALVVLARRRDRLLAGTIVAAGLVAWLGAKVVKEVVGRGRPALYADHVFVREGDGGGLGYVSGHSAVAAATAVVVAAALPRRWRWPVAVAAFLVGVARIVYGVHLTADVVGGWSLGVLVGLAALAVADAARSRWGVTDRTTTV